jgi:Mn-dependent DtxR family transcriptional regulator
MIIVHLDTSDSILLKSKDKSFHTLYHIISQCNPQTHVWYADKVNKTEICSFLGLSLPSLEKMLSSLTKRGFLEKEKRGRYKLAEILTEGYWDRD